MMKKLVALLLMTAMMFTCVACGGNAGDAGNADSGATKVEITDANEILTKVWTEYTTSGSEDIPFPIVGGNIENMIMDTPAKYDLSIEYAQDTLVTSYCIPEASIAMTDDIATMMNMMMANNFTCAAYHVTDAANVEKVVSSIEEATLNNQWMCGFPEKLIIVTVGEDYVVSAFGNAQIITTFEKAMLTVYGEAAVVSVEESLAE